MKSSAAGGRYNFTWYGFAAALPLADAPEQVKFWFIVDGKTEDQGGAGYAIQRDVVHSSTSCRTASFDNARWDVVVRLLCMFYAGPVPLTDSHSGARWHSSSESFP